MHISWPPKIKSKSITVQSNVCLMNFIKKRLKDCLKNYEVTTLKKRINIWFILPTLFYGKSFFYNKYKMRITQDTCVCSLSTNYKFES